MKKTGAFLKFFDKAFVLLALIIAAAILFFIFRPDERVWNSAKVSEKLYNLLERRKQDVNAASVPFSFEQHSRKYSEMYGVTTSPIAPEGWMFYRSPTARPFVTITPTPVREVEPQMSEVSALAGISSPGQVRLSWGKPDLVTDVRLEGYYIFRTEANVEFGSFVLDGKLTIKLGPGAVVNQPLAGPVRETAFTDRTVVPDTAYKYIVVVMGYPARILMKDGKPILDKDGEPVYEIVSAQPVATVSKPLVGTTVPEYQIFLKSVVESISASFLVYKWLRDTEEWVSHTFINVVIYDTLGDVVKIRGTEINFRTGWNLDKLGTETIEVNGAKRRVTYAMLRWYDNDNKTLKISESKQRDPENPTSHFAFGD